MYQVSNAFESAMRYSKKELRVLCDGEPLSTFGVNYTVPMSDSISIGAVSAASVTFKVLGRLDLIGKLLTVEIGVDVDGEINYIPIGSFLVDESKAGDETTTITAYDAAYYAMGGEYVPSASNPPTTALAVLRDVCQQCGIGFALDGSAPIVGAAIVGRAVLGDVDIADQPVTGDLTGHTCREMAGYMAALLGCNAVINRNGDLALRWFADAGQEITPDEYYSGGLKLEGETTLAGLRATRTIKIRTINDDGTAEETDQTETYTAGDGSGTVIAIDNPYATQEIVNAVWRRLRGLSGYRWGSVDLFGGLLTEPGDIVTVTDLQGNVSKVPVMGLTLHLDGGCKATITAGGRTETELAANVQGPMGKALSKVQADIGEFRNLTAENFRATSALIGSAQAAADSKATVYYQASPPTGAHEVNDIWFDTGHGNAMYAWDGSKWAQHQFGTVSIADGAVTADKLTAWDVIAQNVLAQNITATGTIKGLTLEGSALLGESINIHAEPTDYQYSYQPYLEIQGKMLDEKTCQLRLITQGPNPMMAHSMIEMEPDRLEIVQAGMGFNERIIMSPGNISIKTSNGPDAGTVTVFCKDFSVDGTIKEGGTALSDKYAAKNLVEPYDFTSEVAFGIGADATSGTHFIRHNGMVTISFQESSSGTHKAGDVLFIIPDKYRPGSNCNYYAAFVKDGNAYGNIRINGENGKCTVNHINNTTASSRIYFNCTYMIGG